MIANIDQKESVGLVGCHIFGRFAWNKRALHKCKHPMNQSKRKLPFQLGESVGTQYQENSHLQKCNCKPGFEFRSIILFFDLFSLGDQHQTYLWLIVQNFCMRKLHQVLPKANQSLGLQINQGTVELGVFLGFALAKSEGAKVNLSSNIEGKMISPFNISTWCDQVWKKRKKKRKIHHLNQPFQKKVPPIQIKVPPIQFSM